MKVTIKTFILFFMIIACIEVHAQTNTFPTSGNVGIGTTSPAEALHVNGNVRGNQSGALRISTGYGYMDIGPKNTSWAHFNTDRPRFYFNQEIRVNTGYIGSYDEDLNLRTSGTTRINIDNSNGYVGIGTSSPETKLDIVGENFADHSVSAASIPLRLKNTFSEDNDKDSAVDFVLSRWELGGNNRPETRLDFRLAGNDGETYDQSIPNVDVLSLRSDGKVGIGTTNPDQALTVKGKIHSEEIIVDLNVPGPDYVFEPDYDLATLAELEAFIQANKHLPEIPSAASMEEEGIVLGEMNMLLLKKIEELTLYILQQQKEIELLKQLNQQ